MTMFNSGDIVENNSNDKMILLDFYIEDQRPAFRVLNRVPKTKDNYLSWRWDYIYVSVLRGFKKTGEMGKLGRLIYNIKG